MGRPRSDVVAVVICVLCASTAWGQSGNELIEAAKRGNEKEVRRLLEQKKTNIDAKDRSGRTALHWAVKKQHKEIIKLLVEKGAHIDLADVEEESFWKRHIFATFLIGALSAIVAHAAVAGWGRLQTIMGKIFDQYLKVRRDLTETLSELTNLGVLKLVNFDELPRINDDLSRLFYLHYDFLPSEVLLEMHCLNACLASGGRHLYRCGDGNRIAPLDLSKARKVEKFIEETVLVENDRVEARLALGLPDRRSAILNYQARRVLGALNDNFRWRSLVLWGWWLRKRPIYEQTQLVLSRPDTWWRWALDSLIGQRNRRKLGMWLVHDACWLSMFDYAISQQNRRWAGLWIAGETEAASQLGKTGEGV